MFEICRLGDYCVIDTPQKKCCVTEYGFFVEFATCAQCALKSHVSPPCGNGIEFVNGTQCMQKR